MSGNKVGGLQARDKVLAKDKDFYRKIGAMGGSAVHDQPRGFAAMPINKVRAAGRKGGRISRRRGKNETTN